MRKIPTLFRRDPENMARVLTEVHPDCGWVFTDPGVEATRKVDGTCVMFDGTHWWGRREIKPGAEMPPGYQAIDVDPVTRKIVGWQPIEDTPFHKAFSKAVRVNDVDEETGDGPVVEWKPGTYELCGPKVNKNPEGYPFHVLVSHDETERIRPFSMTYEGIRDTCTKVLADLGWEGIVFKHPDGRQAKIKVRDFQ